MTTANSFPTENQGIEYWNLIWEEGQGNEMKRKEKSAYVYTRPILRPKYEYGTIKHSANEYWISLFYILCCSFVVKGGGGLVGCVCVCSL
jgi:hypothetical protein